MRQAALRQSPAAAMVFLPRGRVPEVGEVIHQPDLGKTLEAMALQGSDAFYQGDIASKLVDSVRKAGGIWQLDDLKHYKVIEREPISATFGDFRLISAAPPSSGGIALVQSLNILSQLPPKTRDEAFGPHLVIEAMRGAYRDRADYLGDPDQTQVPVDMLTSTDYARHLARGIHPHKATPSADLTPVVADKSQGTQTTHYSIIDAEGNRVAATLSINLPFGSAFMAPGTGVLLNDEMDDFSIKPGTPNAYGLVGNEANAIAPGKRPLSSMSPTFLESPHGIAILGTPGGSRIISMVLLATLGFQQEADAHTLVSRPRFHHQYLPDQVLMEADAFNSEERKMLEQLGHQLKISTGGINGDGRYGNMQVVIWDRERQRLEAAKDPRGIGCARVAPQGKSD
jgi:gamma-glutamyltranspeptidase/glutathione hydrolase